MEMSFHRPWPAVYCMRNMCVFTQHDLSTNQHTLFHFLSANLHISEVNFIVPKGKLVLGHVPPPACCFTLNRTKTSQVCSQNLLKKEKHRGNIWLNIWISYWHWQHNTKLTSKWIKMFFKKRVKCFIACIFMALCSIPLRLSIRAGTNDNLKQSDLHFGSQSPLSDGRGWYSERRGDVGSLHWFSLLASWLLVRSYSVFYPIIFIAILCKLTTSLFLSCTVSFPNIIAYLMMLSRAGRWHTIMIWLLTSYNLNHLRDYLRKYQFYLIYEETGISFHSHIILRTHTHTHTDVCCWLLLDEKLWYFDTVRGLLFPTLLSRAGVINFNASNYG